MPQHITKSGLNRMVTTTLSEEERELMERACEFNRWSYSGFVKRAIHLLLKEESKRKRP